MYIYIYICIYIYTHIHIYIYIYIYIYDIYIASLRSFLCISFTSNFERYVLGSSVTFV